MNYCSTWFRSVVAGIALLAGLGLTPSALAQFLPSGTATSGGTSANTDVTNQATLNYTISGTAQPAIQSNLSTFKVDNIIRVQVSEVGATHTAVAPGALAQVTTFTVTNTGNSPEDYLLAAGNMAAGTALTFGAVPYTDSFDALSCQSFVESGATAGFQPAEDTAQAIVNLSPVGGGNTRTVYIVCNIPPAPGLTTGDAIVSLTATTYKPNNCVAATGACPIGQIEVQTAGGDTAGTVDIVFADAAAVSPAVPGDAARDGKHSAVDAYRITNASVTVVKSVAPVCDPLNFNTSPKAIPGAFVRYSVTITNVAGATASATLATITDALNANLTFDPNLIAGAAANCTTPESAAGSGFKLQCGGTSTRSCTTPVYYTTAADADAIGIAGTSITADLATALPVVGTCAAGVNPSTAGNYCAGELKPGETVTISFNAIIK